MIRADWPTCFPEELQVAVSSRQDGTMLDRSIGIHTADVVSCRREFMASAGMSYEHAVYQRIQYDDSQTYDVVASVDARDTTRHKLEVAADALMTNEPGVGLFLPIGDCIPTVIYDSERKCVALVHLGRHSTVANLMAKTIKTMVQDGSRAEDIIIWCGPSVQKSSYRLDYFTPENEADWEPFVTRDESGVYIDMQGYNHAQAVLAGVDSSNIHISSVDTATNENYFSHSQGDTAGRFAVAVMIKS